MKFIPTYLYIKQHSITKMLYFGKTTKNPENYLGSGVYWKKHINAHGVNHITTVWFCLFLDPVNLRIVAESFSKINNIAKSDEWANLAEETGFDGGARVNNHCRILNSTPRSDKWKNSQSLAQPKDRTISTRIQIDNVCFPAIVDAAQFHQVSEQTIYNWLKSGKAVRLKKWIKAS